MTETIKEIPLDELHPFPEHPFGVRDDEAMQQTVESVKEYGVIVPAIARPREEGGYEIIAGHRRKHACELVKYLIQLRQSKLCRKGCSQPPYDVTPL